MPSGSLFAGRSRRRIAVSLLLACVLLLISGLLYSPWHRHNLASRQVCAFSPLEGGWDVQAGPGIGIEPCLAVAGPAPVWQAPLPQICLVRPGFGRAPPA
jgi:hypothetical protein